MKLSTLLLSSAALVVAGSAFAADLPAKKGAPAAKAATGCPAFGSGFFQVPGSDTCLGISGYARYGATFTSSTSVMSQAGSGRINFDARSNTEMGALQGYTRVNIAPGATTTASSDRAYVSLGGFTAGAYGSTADIASTATNNIDYQLGYDPSATGMKYSMALGSSTVTVAAENATNTNSYTAKNPDALIRLSTSVAGANVSVVAASHQNTVGQGYAVLAAGSFSGGPAKFGIWGGTSQGAIAYTGTQSTLAADVSGTTQVTGTAFGASVAFAAGSGTLGVDAVQSNASASGSTYSTTAYGIQYALTVAKNFTVTPEFQYSNVEGTASNVTYLRINRDF